MSNEKLKQQNIERKLSKWQNIENKISRGRMEKAEYQTIQY